jgi:hypothetical protein
MAERLEYNENMGSPEAHVAMMKSRVNDAEADYRRALEKGFPQQIEATKKRLDIVQAEYNDFLTGASDEVHQTEKEETFQ